MCRLGFVALTIGRSQLHRLYDAELTVRIYVTHSPIHLELQAQVNIWTSGVDISRLAIWRSVQVCRISRLTFAADDQDGLLLPPG